MNLVLDIQRAPENITCPSDEQFNLWAEIALATDAANNFELCLRIVEIAEIHALNLQYRNQDKPTNVLSFSADLPADIDIPLLGDIVICAPIVEAEALDQEKNLSAHWAHMIIHGILHLLGYDHLDDDTANEMENLEIKLLSKLGFDSPYSTTISQYTSLNIEDKNKKQ